MGQILRTRDVRRAPRRLIVLLCPGVWSSDAAASSADVTQLSAAEHGTTLVTQSLIEQAKQRAAGQAGQAASAAASPLPVLPAYEAAGGLNTRAQGWLKHLHRKATTPDDWSSSGVPNPWWDRYSGPRACKRSALLATFALSFSLSHARRCCPQP